MTTAAPLTVEQLDPATLLVDVNIRTSAPLDKTFLASVRDLGVLVPIVAVGTGDGQVRVRYGHRRTLAAIETGRPTVPVLITGDDDADEAARIIGQWAENEHRASLSTADKLAAVEQLALLGLSPGQIAKRTKTRKTDVDQALAAAGSPLAKGAADRYEFLTLDQAAAVAEFDATPDTVKALVAAAKHGDGEFAHVLQRARDERDEQAQVEAITGELTAAGTPVVERPSHEDQAVKRLDELTGDDKGGPISPEAHAGCPGHAAYVARNWNGVRAVYVCTQWQQAGHCDRYTRTGRPAAGPLDEQAKAARREVVANNRAWRSAQSVRREWLTGFLARKTPPKGATAYLAGELARGGHELRRAMERGHELAAELLGRDAARGRVPLAETAEKSTDARAQVIALGLLLAAVEASTGPHTWRNPTDTTRRYFTFLTGQGYTLAEVEQLATAGPGKARRRKPSGQQASTTDAGAAA